MFCMERFTASLTFSRTAGSNCSALYAHHCMDFSLLILETLREIHANPDIQAYLQNIRYLVVDEYQDVNDLQETDWRR